MQWKNPECRWGLGTCKYVSDDVFDGDHMLHGHNASQVSINSEQKEKSGAVCLVYREIEY